MSKNLYLGIDASTQSMSGIIINIDNPAEITSASINFEKNLPKYKTSSGVVVNPENKNEVWSYPQMWVEALDMLISELSTKVNLANVRAISGAGQQHATVYLKSPEVFSNLQTAQKGKLANALSNAYATERAPIWMDCSTLQECAEIENAVGADYILQKTGSLQTERFSGAQIRKIFKTQPDVYKTTNRVHLNSSFICSVLCNNDAPIDYCDASGMNLLDLHSFSWDKSLLDATAPELISKLPALAKPQTFAGNIGQYFCKNYGFSPDAKVFVFSGDNPSSLVGSGASGVGKCVISLGTSDTLFCANANCVPVAGAHIFGNPSGKYMNLACFRNGSLARESLIRELSISWKEFDNSFENYTPDESQKVMLPFYVDEITPKLKSSHPKCDNCNFSELDKIEIVRMFIEGQFFNLKTQANALNAKIDDILLTGGASKSIAMAQCAANVFNCNVFVAIKQDNSSALGGALQAATADSQIEISVLQEYFCKRKLVASPNAEAVKIYKNKFLAFEKFIKNNINL